MLTKEFTVDWTSKHIAKWSEVLAPFHGKEVRALEIGSFEGRSTVWFLENILTHPRSIIDCVDTFKGSPEHSHPDSDDKIKVEDLQAIEKRFDRNTSEYVHKVWKYKHDSKIVLKQFIPNSYDFIYLDGSHHQKDVMRDACLAWDLLKPGGILIFDDYQFLFYEIKPGMAMDMFMILFKDELELLHQGWQLIIKKKLNPGS